ncbi:hypothetical protein SAMN05660297_01101 [Natronincola peptidivorans]|uniref:Uncharacterized protein n=1 Tax=Natronincola peptidivorans TaxID=426128 RepID=A0A1I0AVT2_9FIRM|nr:hypothetical protein [Natronincola peptidivorans]SES98574.1 hypothetical protein SAMN05660297_01101 [Natronincola peptidivorans]
MSAYSFIGSDYDLPEVHNTKEKMITVKEAIELGIKAHEFMPWEKMNQEDKVMVFESEEDLGELMITKGYDGDEDARQHTQKPFIYMVEFRYTDARGKQLLEYLKENLREGYSLELWSIWLGDKEKITPLRCSYKELSLDHIKQMYEWGHGKGFQPSGMIIEK